MIDDEFWILPLSAKVLLLKMWSIIVQINMIDENAINYSRWSNIIIENLINHVEICMIDWNMICHSKNITDETCLTWSVQWIYDQTWLIKIWPAIVEKRMIDENLISHSKSINIENLLNFGQSHDSKCKYDSKKNLICHCRNKLDKKYYYWKSASFWQVPSFNKQILQIFILKYESDQPL